MGLACLTFVQIYLGWFWQKAAYDISGYSFINFVYVYLIGGYLHRYVSDSKLESQRMMAISLYGGCALLFGICNIARVYFKIPFGNLWAYNNPIMVTGAIGIVLFIRSYKFQSNMVNRIGEGARGISHYGYFLCGRFSVSIVWKVYASYTIHNTYSINYIHIGSGNAADCQWYRYSSGKVDESYYRSI